MIMSEQVCPKCGWIHPTTDAPCMANTSPTLTARDKEVTVSMLFHTGRSSDNNENAAAKVLAKYRLELLAEKEREIQQLVEQSNHDVEELKARLTAMREALQATDALLTRMEEVYRHPHYRDVWTQYHNHGGDYSNGPQWVHEFDKAKSLIQPLLK